MIPSMLVATAPGQPSAFLQLMPLMLIFMVFYFIMWMPIRKKQKAQDAMRGALKKGDRVVTESGFFGEVAKVSDHSVILKLAENVKVKVSKQAIAGLEGSPEDKGGQ